MNIYIYIVKIERNRTEQISTYKSLSRKSITSPKNYIPALDEPAAIVFNLCSTVNCIAV